MEEEKKYSGYGYHGGGRKRKSEAGRVSFCVSCTEEQREAIKKKAEDMNMTVSELILSSVLNSNC